MVKLQWLQVNKFRSVKPGTRLTFNAGHNVLLGQNGTGKTTLLNLIAAAMSMDFTDFKDEEFDFSYVLAADELTASFSVRNEGRSLSILSGVKGIAQLQSEVFASANSLNTMVLAASAVVAVGGAGFQVKIDVDGSTGLAQLVDAARPREAFKINTHQTSDTSLRAMLILGMAQVFAQVLEAGHGADLFSDCIQLFIDAKTNRFDESLGYFERLNRDTLQVVRFPNGSIATLGRLESMGLVLKDLVQQTLQEWGEDRYVLTDKNLDFLRHVVELLEYESAEAILELQKSTVDGDVVFMDLGNLRFYFRRSSGGKISEKALSYGQKRMLAFAHYLSSVKDIVVADELVNGLHHRWIRSCFEMFGERQSFLTSQNPLLLDYLSFRSPGDVQSTFVLCSRSKGSEQMLWENMSQEAAQDFFDSYKVGFQQVGELLQTKGLW